MWAAPRSAAATAVARGGSGPAGPGWSRSGGRRRRRRHHRRRRERAAQRRTEPPPPPPRPGPGGCAAPSRCLRGRSLSRSGHRAGEAGRAGWESGRGLLLWTRGALGLAHLPEQPSPAPPPCCRLRPSWDAGLHCLGRLRGLDQRPAPGTHTHPFLPPAGLCSPLLTSVPVSRASVSCRP